jgi:hypothetical protein
MQNANVVNNCGYQNHLQVPVVVDSILLAGEVGRPMREVSVTRG